MDERDEGAEVITDDELTALALSADPHPVIDPSATPWRTGVADALGLLPDWYMPVPAGRRHGRGTRVAIGIVIGSFVVINALGLCVTYGFVTIA